MEARGCACPRAHARGTVPGGKRSASPAVSTSVLSMAAPTPEPARPDSTYHDSSFSRWNLSESASPALTKRIFAAYVSTDSEQLVAPGLLRTASLERERRGRVEVRRSGGIGHSSMLRRERVGVRADARRRHEAAWACSRSATARRRCARRRPRGRAREGRALVVAPFREAIERLVAEHVDAAAHPRRGGRLLLEAGHPTSSASWTRPNGKVAARLRSSRRRLTRCAGRRKREVDVDQLVAVERQHRAAPAALRGREAQAAPPERLTRPARPPRGQDRSARARTPPPAWPTPRARAPRSRARAAQPTTRRGDGPRPHERASGALRPRRSSRSPRPPASRSASIKA